MRGREKILYLWADGCVRAAGDDMYVLTAIFSRRKSHAHWTATLAAFSPQVVAGVDIGHTSPLTCPSPDLSNASYQRHDRGLHDDHHHRAYLRAHCLSMCAYRSPLFFLFRTRTQNLSFCPLSCCFLHTAAHWGSAAPENECHRMCFASEYYFYY